MNWLDVVPKYVAVEQIAWERGQKILRAKKAGVSFSAISRHFGISPAAIRQTALKHQNKRPPVAAWLNLKGDVAELAEMKEAHHGS